MIRSLGIVTLVGALVCAACMAAAFAIAGPDLFSGPVWERWGSKTFVTVETNGDPQGNPAGFDGPSITRELVWSGANEVIIDIPAVVTFTQGATPMVKISGPQGAVAHVRLEGGTLSFDEIPPSYVEGLVVEMSAPSVTRVEQKSRKTVTLQAIKQDRFEIVVSGAGEVIAHGEARRLTVEIDGSGDVKLEDFKADDTTMEVSGSGDLTASGRGGELDLTVSGSGDADLSGFNVTDATITMEGSGDANVAASGLTVIDIDGSGDVVLFSRPSEVRQSINGSGDVRYRDLRTPTTETEPANTTGAGAKS